MEAIKTLAAALSPLCGIDEATLIGWIEVPKNTEMGDYAFPCFRLSKTLRKAPPAIAASMALMAPLTSSRVTRSVSSHCGRL